MHRITLALALLGMLSTTTFATTAAPKSATVGGGVKNPWTTPYSLAIVTIPEPSSLGIFGLGAAALLARRRGRHARRTRR